MNNQQICFLMVIIGAAVCMGKALDKSDLGKPITIKDCKDSKSEDDDASVNYEEMVAADAVQKPQTRDSFQPEYNIRWKNGTVPYEISAKINEKGRRAICLAINELHEHTCVYFRPRQTEDNYLSFYTGPEVQKCNGSIGMQKGLQEVRLNEICYFSGAMLRLLMHTIGFYSEHTRPDRDCYIDIDFNNVAEGRRPLFEICDWAICHATTLNPYDYGSLLHPSAYYGAVNLTKPVIIPKNPYITELGRRVGLSEVDVERVNRFYKCNGRNRRSDAASPNKPAQIPTLVVILLSFIGRLPYTVYSSHA